MLKTITLFVYRKSIQDSRRSAFFPLELFHLRVARLKGQREDGRTFKGHTQGGRLSGGRGGEADTKEEMKRRWKGGNPWKTEKRGERQREREWERRLEEEVRSRSACSTPVSHVRCTRERTFTGHFQISLPSTATLGSGIFPLPVRLIPIRLSETGYGDDVGERIFSHSSRFFHFWSLETRRFSKGQTPYRSSHSYRILASMIRRQRRFSYAQWERQARCMAGICAGCLNENLAWTNNKKMGESLH